MDYWIIQIFRLESSLSLSLESVIRLCFQNKVDKQYIAIKLYILSDIIDDQWSLQMYDLHVTWLLSFPVRILALCKQHQLNC